MPQAQSRANNGAKCGQPRPGATTTPPHHTQHHARYRTIVCPRSRRVTMARLNTHLSATPQQTRSSTVDSLYRDPSAAPRIESNARTSSYSVLSPSASMNSDKENDEPQSRENTPRPAKRGLRGTSARMPTPDTGSTGSSNGNKRRRTGRHSSTGVDVFQDELEDDDDEDVPEDDVTPAVPEEDEEGDLRFYNPNQDPEKRRRLRATLRDHQRMVEGA